MKKILFPTDFSPAAHKAFQYALALAKLSNARLDVISVYPESLNGKDLFLSPEKQRSLRKEKQKEMEAKMVDFLKDYDYKNIGDKVVYPSDLISDSIVHRSKKNCDLVIMGTKGERNAMDKFLGSVTTNTMMNAGCPVLAIPEDATFEGIKQIAYATSLENKDQLFLEQLASFAKTVGATIDLLHVSKEPTAKAQVLEMEKEFASEFARIHIVDNPSIMEGVDEFLKESHADVLALFIPKRNLWNRLFHKSFSKKMTFHAAIPLFVFHE